MIWAISIATLLISASTLLAETPSLRQTIDAQLQAAWKKENITPAPKSEDGEFLRRIHLDLVGTIPTYDEARAFLSSTDPDKRNKLIAQLLADPRFAQQQATTWDLILFGRNPGNSDAVRKRDLFRTWLTDQFVKNEPYDRWVRQLLLADQEGPELFYVQFQNKPEDLTEAFSKIFLGTQLQCARCHDHPYTPLTQRDFYGMTGFFVRLVVLEQGTQGTGDKQVKRFKIGEKSSGEVMFAGNAKDAAPGRKGEPVKPKFLAGGELEEPALPKDFKEPERKSGDKTMPPPQFSRKEKLAGWATDAQNPFFAKAAVNRVWGQFMGRGIVHPVDNLGEDNKPSMPALLDAMALQFIEQKFDMKWLITEIVSSQAYQLSSSGPAKEAMPAWHERSRVRPLTAEEIQATMRTATMYDPSAKSEGGDYFLRYFGEPTNGQGDFQGGLSEHLFLNNGDQVRKFISRKKGNLADVLISSTEPWEDRVDRMFLSMLTRAPKPAERERFVAFFKSDPKVEQLVEEAIWVLMNTSEFRFNH